MAGLGPGPFAAMMLADHGAEVIRVERAGMIGVPNDPLLRNRRSISLDLKREEHREVVRRLAAKADGLIEGYRPGVMERLGLGPDDLRADHPALVYGRITGWGQHGPLAAEAGHDINYLALTGLLHGLGEPDRPPRPPMNLVADYAGGGMMLAFGMVAALLDVQRGAAGRVVDAAMSDGAAARQRSDVPALERRDRGLREVESEVDQVDHAARRCRRLDEVADLVRAEGDGQVGGDVIAVQASRVDVDAARDVDRDDGCAATARTASAARSRSPARPPIPTMPSMTTSGAVKSSSPTLRPPTARSAARPASCTELGDGERLDPRLRGGRASRRRTTRRHRCPRSRRGAGPSARTPHPAGRSPKPPARLPPAASARRPAGSPSARPPPPVPARRCGRTS